MTHELKKYRFTIFGEAYSLVSDEPEELLQAAAHSIDTLMRGIAQQSQIGDPKKIAVLAAMQSARLAQQCEAELACFKNEQARLVELLDRELLARTSE